MSEFQYYEFQAIDRSLDHAAQAALRRLSTRAEITSHSLVNTYQWGNFKGDSRRLMQDWFDLFIYWANWGSRTLMFRLPRRFLDPAIARPYCVADVLAVSGVDEYVILEIQRNSEDILDDFPDEDGLSAPFAAFGRTCCVATGAVSTSAGRLACRMDSSMKDSPSRRGRRVWLDRPAR